MKARIKKTGEIIEIASYATITLNAFDSWGNPMEMKPEEIELIQDKTDDFDWQSFRNQAAKDILCAMLGNKRNTDFCPDKIEFSIKYADELIKSLKND